MNEIKEKQNPEILQMKNSRDYLMTLALKKNRTLTQIMRMKHLDPLTRWIIKKVFIDRQNCVIRIYGKVQRGKSTIALELAWRVLKGLFDVKFIVFHPEQFSDLYAKGVKRGDVILYEEIGTEAGGLNRRRWYEFNNLLLLDIMQTHGFEGTIMIMTLPSKKYLDSNAEPLLDIDIEAKRVDRVNGTNIFTAYWVEYDEEKKKIYKHCFKDQDGNNVEIFAWSRTHPDALRDSYKNKEHEFKHWVQGRVNEEVRKKKISQDDEDVMFEDIMKNLNSYLTNRNNITRVSSQLIEMDKRVGHRIADRLKMRVEKEILENDAYAPLRESLSSNIVLATPKKTEGGERGT